MLAPASGKSGKPRRILQRAPKPGDVNGAGEPNFTTLTHRIDQLEPESGTAAERQPAPVVSSTPGPAQRKRTALQ